MGHTSTATMAQRRSGIAKEYTFGGAALVLIFAISIAATMPSLRYLDGILTATSLIITVGFCLVVAVIGFVASSIRKDV